MTIYYDQDCGFCERSTKAMQKLFGNRIRIQAGQAIPKIWKLMQEENSWIVEDEDGRRYFRFDGVLRIMKECPFLILLAFLLSLPPFHFLGDLMYRFVAQHRSSRCLR